MKRNVFLVLMISIGCLTSAHAQSNHPLTLADMKHLKSVGSPQLSPDGQLIALSVSQTDMETFESRSVIELIDASTGDRSELIEGSSPQWSPDGASIAYRGNHDDKRGLWLIDIDTKEKRFRSARAHEFFHTWNVKQLRPAGIQPYDYAKENYTKLLWVSEGTTRLLK